MANRIRLSPQQQTAVTVPGHCSLVACPGSGKTRTLVEKLLTCTSEVRGTPRRVGCITYTNSAVYEIERRLREFGSFEDHRHCTVGTIQSFCLGNIVRQFGFVTNENLTNREVLPTESDEFQSTAIDVIHKFSLGKVMVEEFGRIGFRRDGSLILPSQIPQHAAQAFLQKLQEENYLSFAQLLYESYRIISAAPFVAQALSSRFAWILIDEFQDTTELQTEILRSIVAVGRTKVFFVGDPNQSIYGFAGAQPELMGEFATEIGAETNATLTGNYRSSASIIALANRLCRGTPPMEAVGPNASFPIKPVHHQVATPIEAIIDHFLPALDEHSIPLGKASVLAPWWVTLYHLGKNLRQQGIPIIGPGARPYKRSSSFARFIEEVCAFLESGDFLLTTSIVKAFRVMIRELDGCRPVGTSEFQEVQLVTRIINNLRLQAEQEPRANLWLKLAGVTVRQILVSAEVLSGKQGDLLKESANDMVKQINEQLKIEAAALSVSDLGLFARPQKSLRLQTIHSAKGCEYDAVAVIDLHDGKLPHHTAKSDKTLTEERRKLYVACTRPRKILMLFTDLSDWRNRPSRFLRELGL